VAKEREKAKGKNFCIIGLGTFGRKVCEVLSEGGAEVIAIDNRSNHIERIKDDVSQAMLLDATDEEALSNVPFEDVDIALIAIGDNIEASILTTAILKRIGVPYIIARAITDIHQQVLRQIGADEVINIEIDEGQRLARRLIAPAVLDRIPLSESISVTEMYVPEAFVNKALVELALRNKFNINVVTIRRMEVSVDELGNPVKDERVIFPEASEKLKEEDVLILVGKNEDIERFKEY